MYYVSCQPTPRLRHGTCVGKVDGLTEGTFGAERLASGRLASGFAYDVHGTIDNGIDISFCRQ